MAQTKTPNYKSINNLYYNLKDNSRTFKPFSLAKSSVTYDPNTRILSFKYSPVSTQRSFSWETDERNPSMLYLVIHPIPKGNQIRKKNLVQRTENLYLPEGINYIAIRRQAA